MINKTPNEVSRRTGPSRIAAGPDEPIEIAALSDDDEFEQVSETSNGTEPAGSPGQTVRRNTALQTAAYTPARTSSVAGQTIVIVIPKPTKAERVLLPCPGSPAAATP